MMIYRAWQISSMLTTKMFAAQISRRIRFILGRSIFAAMSLMAVIVGRFLIIHRPIRDLVACSVCSVCDFHDFHSSLGFGVCFLCAIDPSDRAVSRCLVCSGSDDLVALNPPALRPSRKSVMKLHDAFCPQHIQTHPRHSPRRQ